MSNKIADYKKKSKASYEFPIGTIRSHPRISIIVLDRRSEYPMELILPIPQGLPIQDGISYSSTNLNQVGAAAQDAMSGLGSGASMLDVGSKTIDNMKNNLSGQSSTTTAAALTQIANSAGLAGSTAKSIADAVMYNKRSLLNPNQVTTFSGTNVRSFSFEFKFVSISEEESLMIRNIIERLRLNAYPKGNQVILSYPPEFMIHVLDKNGERNRYYGAIDNCFLMNISTAYNTIGNSYYDDGAPLDVSLSLTFQETKALTRDDIIRLQNSVESNKGGI